MGVVIVRMCREDWPAVASVYAQGIETGDATFEKDVPTWEEWDLRHLPYPRLVACLAQRLVGWAALSPVSTRSVYRGVAEVSIYVAAQARGRGVGKELLCALIAASEQADLWTLQAGIFPENLASLALHRSCGFREVGRRERLGHMQGRWRDVILLERRSQVAGV